VKEEGRKEREGKDGEGRVTTRDGERKIRRGKKPEMGNRREAPE
jgi:hypothetical protein